MAATCESDLAIVNLSIRWRTYSFAVLQRHKTSRAHLIPEIKISMEL